MDSLRFVNYEDWPQLYLDNRHSPIIITSHEDDTDSIKPGISCKQKEEQ